MADRQDSFRSEVRAWLEQNCPASMRVPIRSDEEVVWGGRNAVFRHDDQRLWLERMASRGWTVPTWPAEYGGGGLDKAGAQVLRQELASMGCRSPLQSFGISMLGPALLKYGNEAQKREHIPKIAKGEIRWCQGYSEPGAGSDLAGLQTRAEDAGDHYLVNGSKVWTSFADKADWIFCLVRTSSEGRKQQGISFLLFDMASEGVSTSPIRLISGNSPFCETHFNNVKVPRANLMGEEGKGWAIAKYLLTHEREMIGEFGGGGGESLSRVALDRIGSEHGRLADPILRGELLKLELDLAAFSMTMGRVVDEARTGQGLGARSSMLKYVGTELNKRRYELLMAMEGMQGLGWDGEAYDDGVLPRQWLRSKANSIEGGTSEIQLNIIAKGILGLPS